MSKKSCFVICPIGSEGSPERKRANDLLKYIINKSLDGLDYTIIRADRIAKPGMITTQIIENLMNADLVIADLYDYNPNVFYELGIRHTYGKPIIQIYHPDQRLPFDVAGLRSIKLDITDLESVEKCVQELTLQTKAVEANPEDVTSPVSITIDMQTLKSSETSMETILSRIMESIENLRSELIPQKELILERREEKISHLRTQYNSLISEKIKMEEYIHEFNNELEKLQEKSSKTKEEKQRIKEFLARREAAMHQLGLIDRKCYEMMDMIEHHLRRKY